ncbi:nitroreductase family protein [Streptomyces longwoodensis]|uniref:nitroreductase family protein n=1 Tax=Streptomyces longwoodensis TaxID=68231 RepID=UPI0037BD1FF9
MAKPKDRNGRRITVNDPFYPYEQGDFLEQGEAAVRRALYSAPATGELTGVELLTTTRSVRRRLDFERPVDIRLVYAALSDALQAPNGSNEQPWQWIVVTEADKRRRLAECYRRSARPYLEAMADQAAEEPERAGVWRASAYLAEHLHRVPVLVVPCLSLSPDDLEDRFRKLGLPAPVDHVAHSVYYGSVWPAMWSLMLALRLRGLACAVTALHLARAQEAAEILHLPDHVTQAGLLAVAYPKGKSFRPAPRKSVREVVHHDSWHS